MKKLLKFAAFFALLPFLIVTSCSDDGDDPQPDAQDRFDVLKKYLIDNNMDISTVIGTGDNVWITTAENVHANMEDGDESNDYFIIDIRSAEDFTAKRISGAVNSTLGNILTTAAGANGHPIIVVCYTGQTAGHAVIALRLSGYADAKVMKWGMSSWNAETATAWQTNVGDAAEGNTNWVAAPGDITDNTVMTAPKVEYVTDDGAEILAEQVQNMLANGFKGVTNEAILSNPDSHFINNLWDEENVTEYGNIKTSYRIKPLTLANGEYVYLDGTASVVTYCWTGQTSSMMTAYLSVLGYDAYSLKFGANGMIHSDLQAHKWSDAQIMGYDLTYGGSK
jgi:rhodanese-related sulfurtransferase